MESAELSQALSKSCLRRSSPPDSAHRRLGDGAFSYARLSAGLFSFVPRWPAQGTPLSTGDRAAVGELSGARLCLEDHPGKRRSVERFSTLPAHHEGTRCLSALQSVRRCLDAHPYLHSVCFPADLR